MQLIRGSIRSLRGAAAGRPAWLVALGAAGAGLAWLVVVAIAAGQPGLEGDQSGSFGSVPKAAAAAEDGASPGATATAASSLELPTPAPTPEPTPAPSAAPAAASPTEAPTATPEPTPAPTFGPTGPTEQAVVTRVIDGDTIEVELGGALAKVRYIGMDTPETKDPNSPVEWMGPQASAANEALVEGRTVILEKDVSETDRYGRLLRDVWVREGDGWLLVDLELVRRGFAAVSTYPPDVKYVEQLLAAQDEAREAGVGLWGPEPTSKPAPYSTPKPTTSSATCHPSYDPCLPIVDDLDCPDVRAMGVAPVHVIGPDEYRLDRDNDGLGCE